VCELKLVILYDAAENTYEVSGHNLSAEEAEAKITELRGKQSLPPVALDQRAKHHTPDAQSCRSCRREVGRTPSFESKPKFKRRIEA
jgi:hypothetical protein